MKSYNFKYPLALEVSDSERLVVRLALTELGYNWASDFDGDHINYPFLCTSYFPKVSRTMGNDYHNGAGVSRIKIKVNDEQSRKFALAVAAMRDETWEDGSPRFFKGESIIATDSSHGGGYIAWCMYTVKQDQDLRRAVLTVVDEKGSTTNGWHSFRKATYDEISNQFGRTKKKRIREYKFKPGCEEKFKRTVTHILSTGLVTPTSTIRVGSLAEQLLREHNVLDLWFDLEKDEKDYEVGDWVFYRGVEGDGHGYNRANRIIQLLPKDEGQYATEHISGLCRDTSDDFVCYAPQSSNKYFRIAKVGIERFATPEEVEFETNLKLKTFKLKSSTGDFFIEVSSRGIYYAPEKKFLDPQALSRICGKAEMFSEEISGYIFSATHIDSGCKKNVLISDWKEVVNYYFSIVKK